MRPAAASLLLAALAGCAGSPPSAVPGLLAPRGGGAEQQVRRYEGVPPAEMMPTALAALQDLGFHVTSSDAGLGLVVARRGYQKSFEELSRDFWPGFSEAMRRMFTLRWSAPPEAEVALVSGPAAFNATLVVTPQASGSAVRISFHRFVSKPSGEPVILWAEEVRDPEPYAAFFEQLSRALAVSSPAPPPASRAP